MKLRLAIILMFVFAISWSAFGSTAGEIDLVQDGLMEVTLFKTSPGTAAKSVKGYLVVGDKLEALPVGSTLDAKKGIFYWQPGPVFQGEFRFLFKSEKLGKEEHLLVRIGHRTGKKFQEFSRVNADTVLASPFGEFATPIDGSTVRSSIAVTGWALDDDGVSTVQLFQGAGTGGTLNYVGDATFVDGARPDIAAAYPSYPGNTRAGWGYMMLTNFLPGGDGTFTLTAIATDTLGNQTSLGSKVITVDNDNAVKPFGAIDAPAPGGEATGTNYRNLGWALTPLPNTIPTNGSTIRVYINGLNWGNVTYNLYRPDIASLFPDNNNSSGAAGYLDLDTTEIGEGFHTISWVASDDANNTDGIGSRYFNVRNNNLAGTTWNYINYDLTLGEDYQDDSGTIAFTGAYSSGTYIYTNFYGYDYNGTYTVNLNTFVFEGSYDFNGTFIDPQNMEATYTNPDNGHSMKWVATAQ
ncbi:MAG: hypothetical protein GY757_07305 [bacterium]|nr:hypothetical protein [bacterium]